MRFSAALTARRILPKRLAARAMPLAGRLDVLLEGRDAESRAARMGLIAFVVRVFSAVLALASQILLARWMGGFEYGIFVLVWTAIIILGNLSGIGFHTSVIRFIPEYAARERHGPRRGVLMASRLIVLVSSTLITLAGLAAIHLLSRHIEPFYLVPFLLGMVCLPMIALSDLMQGVARAHAWAFVALLPTFILRPLLILLFMAAALWAGYAANARTAIVAAILATYATTLYQLIAVSNPAEREGPAVRREFRMREWMIVSLPIFLIEAFYFILTNADVLIVGFFMEPTDVAVYFATVKVLALVHFVYYAVRAGAAQRFAHIVHGPEPETLRDFARQTVVWTFWPSLAVGLLLLAVAQPLLALFGPGFGAGYPLLFVLVAGVLARASVGPAESLLTMGGHHNACAVAYGVSLAGNIALNFMLIPPYGLWGAALATAAAMTLEAVLLSGLVRRRFGISMWIGTTAAARPRPGTVA